LTSQTPRVSIVVTVRNEEANIAELLDSISKLDLLEKVETVIVDGGSTDRTVEIISSRYPDVKLITSNCSIGEGKNIGIKNSNGEIIAFTDGDCVVDKDWTKKILEHFDAMGPQVGAVGGPYLPPHQSGLIAQYLAIGAEPFFPAESVPATYKSLPGGNVAYRRGVVVQVGGFDSRLLIGEDYDLNFRINNLGYELFFARDVKVYHKYRSTFRDLSKLALTKGRGSTTFNKKTKNYRKLLFPFARTALLAFFILMIFSLLTGNSLMLYAMLLLLPCYYFYKLAYFLGILKNYQQKISLETKLFLPIINLYMMAVMAIGSTLELVTEFVTNR